MQEDFNQENINPDLDQETSNLGIDLTLDSEENQIQGIEASDSAFSDLDYFNAPPPVTPEEVELFNLSDQETKAKENFNKKKQDLYEVKLSDNKINKKIESLNEEGEEDEVSLDGFDRSTFDKIDLEIKSKYGENVSIETIQNYMISKRDKLEKDFEEEFEKEIGFKYGEWNEKGSIVGPTGRSMAQAILDDFKEDAKAYDKERQEVLDIIDSFNKLATEESRKRELNKIKSKGISKDHQPGDAVEMKDNIVLLFEYKKDKDGKINRVLKQEFDYDELEKRYVKSGGWETVEDFMFNYNKKSGAYSSRQIKKGGVLAFEYVGINQPRLIEKKYWGEPLKDNLGNDVVFQEPIKIMPFLMELEVATEAKPDFIVVPEDGYRVVSTDFGGYTREEFNNLSKTEKDKIYEESEKKYREEVEPKRRIEREDFWDNLFDDSKFWRREEDVAAQMYSQLLPGKFKVEEDGEEYIKITNTTNGASVTIATDLEGFDQTEKYKEKSKLTNFLVNNTTSQDVDQAKKYKDKSVSEYNILTSTPHTEGGLDLTQSEYEEIDLKVNAIKMHEIRLQQGGAYLEYSQRSASTSGRDPYEEYYSILSNFENNLLRFNKQNGIKSDKYLVREEAKKLAYDQYKKVLVDREKEKIFEKYYEGKGGLKGKAKALVGDLLLTNKLETKQDKAEIQFHQSSSAVEKFDTHYIESLQKLIKNDDGFGNKIKGSGSGFEKNTQDIKGDEPYYQLDNGLKVPAWLYDRAISDQMQLENLHTKAVDDYNYLLETIKQVDNFDSQWEILTKNYNDFEAFFVKAGLSIADVAVGLTHSLNYFAEFINPVTLTLKAFGINDPLDMDKAAMAWGETKNDIINSYASVSYEDRFDTPGSFMSFHTHLIADQGGNLIMGALLPTSIGGLGYGLTSFSAKRADMMTLMTNGDANYSATELFWKPFFFGAAEGVFGAAGQIKVTKNVLGTLKKSKDVLDDLYKSRFDYIKTNFLKTDGVLHNMFIEGVTEGLTQGTQNVIDGVSFWKDVDVASYSGFAVAGGMSTSAVFSTSIMKDFTGEKELKRIYELNQKIDSIQRRISEIEYGVVGGNVGDLKLEKQRLTQEGDLLVDEVNDIISGVENNLIKKSIEKEAGDMHIKNMLKLSEIRTKVDDVLKDESLSDSNKKDQIDELRKDYINIKRETDVFTDTNTWGSGWNALKGAQYYTLDRNKRKEYKEIRNKAIDNIKRRRGQEQFFTTEKITEEQIDAEAKEVYIEKRVDENRDKALKLFKKLKLEGLSIDIMTFDTKEEAVEYLDNIYDQLLEGETNTKTIESIEKERKLAVEGVKQGLVNGFKSSKYDQEISVRENAIKNKMAGTEFHELWHTMSAYLQSIDPEAFEEFSLQVQAYLTTYQPKILSRMIAKNSTLKESIERGELDYDEFNASFFEMVAEGRVDLNKIPNFAVVLGQIYNDGIRKGYGLEEGIAFQGENDIVNFFTALGVERKKGVFNKLAKFKKPRKIKISKKPKAKVKSEETKFSKTDKEELVDEKQLGDQINEIFPRGMTEFNSDKVQGDIYNKLVSGNMLDNLIRKQLTKKGIDAKDPSAKVFNVPIGGQEGKIGFIEDVKFKLYEKTILRFDPEKNDDFGGFIVSELVNYRIGDTWKDARKTSKEIRTPQYGDQDVDFASPTTTNEIINKIDEESYGTPKIELETAFNPEVKDLFQKAKEIAKEKYTPKFTFKNFKGFLIDEAQTVFGIDPKTGTLNATDIQNAQKFIADNWESVFVFITPEGITPSGTSTGVQKVIQREFYLKDEDRVTQAKTGSAAGLYEQSRTNETIEAGNLIKDKKGIENKISELQDELENPMTPEVEKNSIRKRIKKRKEEILDINKKLKPMKDKVFNFFDISTDPEVSLVDRDGRSTTSSKIKAAVIQFERSMMVEAIKKSDENFESKIFEGQSEIMFSKKAKFTETLSDLQKGLNSEDILYNVVGDIIIELENKKPKNQYQAYKIIDNYAADILSKRNHNKLKRQIFEFSDPDQRITIADYVGGIQKLFKYQQRSLGYGYAVNRLKDSVDGYKNDQDKIDAVKDFLKYVSRSIRTLGINGLTTNEKIFNEIISPILGENKLGFELVKKDNKTFIYHNNERLQGFSDVTLIKQNPSEMSFMMFNESKEAANALIQILDSTPNIENKIGFLSLISSDQRGLLRKLSQPGFYMEGKPSDLILEHETEVSTIFKKFKNYSEGSINKKQLLDFIDKSKVNIVTKAVDNKLFKNKLKGLNNDARYKGVKIKNKKPFKNKVQEVNIKNLSNNVIKFSQNMSNSEILSLAATIDAILNLAKNPNTPVKKIRVFDFDDTLAQTKSNVNYVMLDGTKGKLTAEEFAKKGDAMAAKGAQWDFSEFNKVMEGKKGPLFNVAERIQRARGTEDLFVLTARAPEAASAIKEFLDSVGLNIPIENITGLGNSSPFAKSQWVIEKAAEGYNDFYFADDHIANVEAVQDALDQLTDVKSRTQVAIVSDEAVTEEQNMNRSIDSPTEEGSEGLLDIRFSKKNRDLYIKQLTKRRKDLLPEEITFNVDQVFMKS
jgi:hypothetical protein